MTAKVLVVDDSEELVESSCSLLARSGYSVHGTTDIPEALSMFRDFQPDVCLLDYNMPQMQGGELARTFKAQDSTVEVLFLTGVAETQLAIDLMKDGALDYLMKPVDLDRLFGSIDRAMDHRRLVRENILYREHLEERVAQQTAALGESLRQLEHLSAATLDTLGMALDYRDHSTSGHSKRVMTHTAAIARKMGYSGAPLLQIQQGAFLHDLGKLRIPDAILLKSSSLSPAEWETMRRHPEYGRDFLRQIDFLAPAAEMVYTHHEKFDGSGYPQGLRGEAIPVGSRIFAIVDALDAMTYLRPYSQPISIERAMEEIRRCSGSHFDPEIVPIALDYFTTRLLAAHKRG